MYSYNKIEPEENVNKCFSFIGIRIKLSMEGEKGILFHGAALRKLSTSGFLGGQNRTSLEKVPS